MRQRTRTPRIVLKRIFCVCSVVLLLGNVSPIPATATGSKSVVKKKSKTNRAPVRTQAPHVSATTPKQAQPTDPTTPSPPITVEGTAGPTTELPARQTGPFTTGDISIRNPGAVIDGLRLMGTIYVAANNVTIRNCEITANEQSNAVIQQDPGVSGLVVQGCRINGVGLAFTGISAVNKISVQNSEITGTCDGLSVGSDFTIENSRLHSFSSTDNECHYDGIQILGGKNGIIKHNSVILLQAQTSAIGLWTDFGDVSNVSVENNIVGGGGYTLYLVESEGRHLSHIRFSNNEISQVFSKTGGYWGAWYPSPALDVVERSNTRYADGSPVLP